LQEPRLKVIRFNYRKHDGARVKDATKMSLGKLNFHIKHGTSNASFVGDHLLT